MTSPAPAPRILVVRFSSIGDLVLITPLLRALRTRHPDCYLAVATKEEFAPLLRHNPHIDRIIEFAAGDRVFHQKFGYGHIVAVDGNRLDIAFDKAGTKKVIANFVEPA